MLSRWLSGQWVLLLALLPPCAASGAWQRRGAAHDCVTPPHLGPFQRLSASRLHVHLPPPSDTKHRPRRARCRNLPADGPRGRYLQGFHAAALVGASILMTGRAVRVNPSGWVWWLTNISFMSSSKENTSARSPQLELDSRVSAPKGRDLPHPGPQRLLPAARAARLAISLMLHLEMRAC